MIQIKNWANKHKNILVACWLVVIFLISLFWIVPRSFNKLMNQYRDSVITFKNDLITKNVLEGKNVNAILPGVLFNSIINELSSKDYGVLLLLDSISCYSCIKFHLEHLERLNKKGLVIFAVANDKYQLVKSYINKSVRINVKKGMLTVPFHYELLILLIDKNGKILKLDVADKNNYFKSQLFYNILERFANY